MRSLAWTGVVLCTVTVSSLLAAEPTLKLTTLSDPSIEYRVAKKPYVVLRRADVEAVVVDNRAVDDEVLARRVGHDIFVAAAAQLVQGGLGLLESGPAGLRVIHHAHRVGKETGRAQRDDTHKHDPDHDLHERHRG